MIISKQLKISYFGCRVSCGLPSPADDYIEDKLDLNEALIPHPAATFFIRASGESMQKAGISSGDLLIVDRSLTPKSGDIVIAAINGELTVKRLSIRHSRGYLVPENDEFTEILVSKEQNVVFWGVVTHVIHEF